VAAVAACFGTMFFARDQPCAPEEKVIEVVEAVAAAAVVVGSTAVFGILKSKRPIAFLGDTQRERERERGIVGYRK